MPRGKKWKFLEKELDGGCYSEALRVTLIPAGEAVEEHMSSADLASGCKDGACRHEEMDPSLMPFPG